MHMWMKICIIYHSETGNTRHVAQHISSAFDSQLVEITDTVSYNRGSRGSLSGARWHAVKRQTVIEPESVDVSDYDLVVFGSPVWAFKPTPAIHAAIDGLKGCMGKPAVAFSTHGGRPGQTDETFKKWIEARGMVLVAVTNIQPERYRK